jgi:hypothetical protein
MVDFQLLNTFLNHISYQMWNLQNTFLDSTTLYHHKFKLGLTNTNTTKLMLDSSTPHTLKRPHRNLTLVYIQKKLFVDEV